MAAGGRVQPQQRFFDFADRPAQAAVECGAGLFVAPAGSLFARGDGAAVEDRQRERRAESPGAAIARRAAHAQAGHADAATEGEARIARGLGHADLGRRGDDVALGRGDVGPLREQLRRQAGHDELCRLRQLRAARRQALAQRGAWLACQHGQRLQQHVAVGALGDGAVAGVGGGAVGQGAIGRRFEADANLFARQRRGLFLRARVLFEHGALRLAGAQRDIGLRHLGGQADAGVVPTERGLLGARLCRGNFGPRGAEEVDFPLRVGGGAGLGRGHVVAGGIGAAAGLCVQRQRGPPPCFGVAQARPRLADARQRQGDARVAGLRLPDEHGQQRVVEAAPPVGQRERIAAMRQRCVPGRGRGRVGLAGQARRAARGQQERGGSRGHRRTGRAQSAARIARAARDREGGFDRLHRVGDSGGFRWRARSCATRARPQSTRRSSARGSAWGPCSSAGARMFMNSRDMQ